MINIQKQLLKDALCGIEGKCGIGSTVTPELLMIARVVIFFEQLEKMLGFAPLFVTLKEETLTIQEPTA